MMKCEAMVGGSSDNDSPYHERKPRGREVWPKVGIAINHSENVDQASEQGRKPTPQPAAKSGTTAGTPPPLQQLEGRDRRSPATGVVELESGW